MPSPHQSLSNKGVPHICNAAPLNSTLLLLGSDTYVPTQMLDSDASYLFVSVPAMLYNLLLPHLHAYEHMFRPTTSSISTTSPSRCAAAVTLHDAIIASTFVIHKSAFLALQHTCIAPLSTSLLLSLKPCCAGDSHAACRSGYKSCHRCQQAMIHLLLAGLTAAF